MRARVYLPVLALLLFPIGGTARGADDASIADYKCGQFLEDVMKPKEATPLLRSMLAIAWSTGYAAAYQKDNARADPKAFRLIAAALASVCSQHPDKTVVEAAVQEVHAVFTDTNK